MALLSLAPSSPAAAPVPRHRPAAAHHRPAAAPAAQGRPGRPIAGLAPLATTISLLLGASLLAPEQPWHQEAICQRHNGVEACRVW